LKEARPRLGDDRGNTDHHPAHRHKLVHICARWGVGVSGKTNGGGGERG
jgi:hypothetical protein